MKHTMQDVPLTLDMLIRHGATVHPSKRVISVTREGSVEGHSFAEVAQDATRLATWLWENDCRGGDVVATLMWNQLEHFTTYLATTGTGLVVNPMNPRLDVAQNAHVMRQVRPRVVIVDESLLPHCLEVLEQVDLAPTLVVVGSHSSHPSFGDVVSGHASPELPKPTSEEAPAVVAYTSGTTGMPKGVVYSHRSIWLHAQVICTPNIYGIGEGDRILASVPIYHTNAASLPLAGWISGADLVLPGSSLAPANLAGLMQDHKVTHAVGVATLWNDLLRWWEGGDVDLSSLKLVVSGGSAPPEHLIRGFRSRGVPIIQGWGMTESIGINSMGHPPVGADPEESLHYLRTYAGRVVPGVEVRMSAGVEPTREGDPRVGELEVRGPWVTATYLGATDEPWDWFKTGDVGYVTADGYVAITDRLKDVIKSGGEWISSLDLEKALASHPSVESVCVVGIPDERWQERPLALIVPARERIRIDELKDWLAAKVPRWWMPEKWVEAPMIPVTPMGKPDKAAVRRAYADGHYHVLT